MKNTTPIKAYIDAYLAVLPKDADAVAEIDALTHAFESIKTLRSFVGDHSIDAKERREALDVALPLIADATKNLGIILADEGKMKDLARLPGLVRNVVATNATKRHAVVTSATPLKASELKRVGAALERVVRTPVTLEEQIDASLIAGFSVSLGDWTFDASLKGKLNRLDHALTV